MEGVKLDLALESGRQSLNDHGAQGRFGAVDHDAQYRDCEDQQQCESGEPTPTLIALIAAERVLF
jgi:hypothetical protein